MQLTADKFIESELWNILCFCNEFKKFNDEFDEFNTLLSLQQH